VELSDWDPVKKPTLELQLQQVQLQMQQQMQQQLQQQAQQQAQQHQQHQQAIRQLEEKLSQLINAGQVHSNQLFSTSNAPKSEHHLAQASATVTIDGYSDLA
jgi:DNA-binding protein H-NS